MAGTLGSFFAGFLISITFSLPVAIIVGIVFGLLKIIFGDEYISLTLQSSKVCPCYVGK